MRGFKVRPTLAVLPFILLGLVQGKNTRDIGTHWWLSGVPLPGYDCTGKADGTYPHPTECTAYVACVEGTYAYEIQCNPSPTGSDIQHYIVSSGPDPSTSKCGSPEEANCELIDPPQDPVQCNPNECKETGNCNRYRVCSEGTWENQTCGEGLYWNPEILNGFGGACDYWSNLGDNLKTKYSIDPECIPPCKWWQEESERCGPIFHYRVPFDSNNPQTAVQRDTVQKCPSAPADSGKPGLIWNPEKVSCDKPSNVLGCVGILPESPVSV